MRCNLPMPQQPYLPEGSSQVAAAAMLGSANRCGPSPTGATPSGAGCGDTAVAPRAAGAAAEVVSHEPLASLVCNSCNPLCLMHGGTVMRDPVRVCAATEGLGPLTPAERDLGTISILSIYVD